MGVSRETQVLMWSFPMLEWTLFPSRGQSQACAVFLPAWEHQQPWATS